MLKLKSLLIAATSILGVFASGTSAQPFIEASTSAQKIGYTFGSLSPFIAGNVEFTDFSDNFSDGTTLHYTVGAGIDYTKKLSEIDLGLRLYETFSTYRNGWGGDQYNTNILAIASKTFGPLSIGGGAGPKVSYSKAEDSYNSTTYSLGSELFVRYNF